MLHRHKAAINRHKLSRPCQRGIDFGFITPETTITDYGCGYGQDAERLSEMGYPVVSRYDPYYFADSQALPADAVMLNFVLSVIEDPAEREQVLIAAWNLAQKYLIVGLLTGKAKESAYRFNDGIITKWNTFEKHYSATSGKAYLQAILGCDLVRLENCIWAIPKVPSKVLNAYNTSATELQRLLANFKKQRYRLNCQTLLPQGAYIEDYSPSNSDRTYYRLRSPNRDLLGKKGKSFVVHLGTAESPEFKEAAKALQRREQLDFLTSRIDYIQQVLKEPAPTATKVTVAPKPGLMAHFSMAQMDLSPPSTF
ncbi:MAG: DNA phosphorothioation-associated putative methyltransferase (plasmid) [Microcoleus anatoxicus]|uniref:DNA phosphorothioation-associated putative methyltransferase n=1 Tax=Microcoleus anatoxicus TaxID=2705319 RepID=UPI00366D6902